MNWTVDKSRALYKFQNWAESYFNINEQGHLVLKSCGTKSGLPGQPEIDLYLIAQILREQGLQFPALVRFIDVLHDRVIRLYSEFEKSILEFNYKGHYHPVYPIKVNQQFTVVRHMTGLSEYPVGLEAGSKPELIACLSMAGKQSVIVCNGYKDREYIRLAVIARKLGHRIYIVLEKPSEVELIAEQAREFEVEVLLGARIRLSNLNSGNWQNTGGEKSKFGFSATGLIELIETVEQAGLVGSMRLLHFHMGSQIANLAHFRQGIREAMQYYVQLCARKIPLDCIDVGGGLAVDYDGTASTSYFSMNYQLGEYTNTLLQEIKQVCDQYQLTEPDIITEAGRAMSAHHGVLIVDVIEQETRPELLNDFENFKQANLTQHETLFQIYDSIEAPNCSEIIEQARKVIGLITEQFSQGIISIEQKSTAETLYYQLCHKALKLLESGLSDDPVLKQELEIVLADKYFCNMSIFQSLPDIWGIEQIFPIVPLHRLNERPGSKVLLKDLTCDSDGRIDNYLGETGIEKTLKLHPLLGKQPYLLGIFLVGAYQEILGDMHNLFGDTHSVDVHMDESGKPTISNIDYGDDVTQVLELVHYDLDYIIEKIQVKIEQADISKELRELITRQLFTSLESYTYLDGTGV